MASRTLQIEIIGDPASASRAFRKVGQDADRMSRDVEKSGGRIRGFATVTSKGMGRVGLAATGMATAGAGAAALLAKSFVTGATDIQESLSKNEVLFGKNARSIAEWSKSTAGSLGVSRQAALEATGTFGNLFVALDIGPQKAAKMSANLVQLSADLASFNNATPEEALEAIRSGLVGETEPLRRFGVNLNDATLRTEALRMGLVKTTKEALEPQQKALAVNSLLFKQTEKAQGDFARTSGGLANQQRILRARLSDAGAELGGTLMPAALAAVRAFNSLFDESSRGGRVIRTLRNAISDASEWIRGAFRDAIEWGRRFAASNREEFREVARAFKNVGEFARDVFQNILIPVVKRVLPVLQGVAEGIVQAVRGLIRIVTGLINGDWSRAWEGLKDVARGAVKAVKSILGGLWRALRDAIKALGPLALEAAKDVGKMLGKGILDGVKSVISGDSGLLDTIARGFPGATAIRNLGKAVGDGVGKAVIPSMGVPGLGGGSLDGADPDLAPFAGVGARFGLRVSSGIRPGSITSSGNQSYHATGDAIDLSGPTSGMMATFRFLRENFGPRLRELIYTPGGVGIKDGRPYTYSGAVAQDHYDHVHVAYTGPFGDGIGDAARSAAKFWKGNDLITAVAVAGPESTYRDSARLVTSQEDSRGMWQVNTYAHPWAASMNLRDTDQAARAAYRVWRQSGGSWRPWTGFTSGRYKGFLGQARAAVAALGRRGGGAPGASGGGGGAAGKLVGQVGGGGSVGAPWMKGNKGKLVGGQQVGVPGGWADPAALENMPSGTDYIDREIALAALTAGTADDKAAAERSVGFWRRRLSDAGLTADPRDDTEAAQGLKAALDALEALTGELEVKRRQEEMDRALREEQVANQRKIIALASQGQAIKAAVIAMFNGDIGGPVALSYQSSGLAPGQTVRY